MLKKYIVWIINKIQLKSFTLSKVIEKLRGAVNTELVK